MNSSNTYRDRHWPNQNTTGCYENFGLMLSIKGSVVELGPASPKEEPVI